MALTLGTLLVKLEAHTSGFSKGMKDMRNLSFNSAKDISNSLGSIGKALKGLDFSGAAGGAKAFGIAGAIAGTAIAGITTAAIATGKAIADMTLEASKNAEKIGELSQAAGVTGNEFSKLAYAARFSGVGMEDLSALLGKFSKKIAEADKATQNHTLAIGNQQIALRNADGQARNTEAILGDLFEIVSKMPDGWQKSALMIELFGRSGAKIIPWANEGRVGLEKLTNQAVEFGHALSDNAIRASDEFNDNLEKLSLATKGFANRVLEGSIGALAVMTEHLVNLASKSEAAKIAADFLSTGIVGVAASAILASTSIAKAVSGLAAWKTIPEAFAKDGLNGVKRAWQEYRAEQDRLSAEGALAWAKLSRAASGENIFGPPKRNGGLGNTPTLPSGVLGSREANKDLQDAVSLLGQIRERALGIVDPAAKVGEEWDKDVAKLETLAAKFPQLKNEIGNVIALAKQAKIIDVNKEDLKILEDANRAVQDYAKSIEDIPQFPAPAVSAPVLNTDIFGARLQELQDKFGELGKGTEEFGRAQTEAFNQALTAEQRYELGLAQLNLLLDDSVDGQRARTRIEHELSEQRIRDIGEELLATRNFVDGAKVAFLDYVHNAKNAAENAYRAFQNSFQSIEDALTDLLSGDKVDFRSIESGILKEFNRALVIKPVLGSVTAKLGDLFGLKTSELSKPDGTSTNPIHTIVDNSALGNLDFGAIGDQFSNTALEIGTEFGGVINNTDQGFQNMIAKTDSGFSGVVSKIGSALNSLFSRGGSSGGGGFLDSLVSGAASLFAGGGATPMFSFSGGEAALAGSSLGGFTGTGGGWDMLFADGGVTNRPAIFGESGPEAAVPLPDGCNIPVKLMGSGESPKVEVNMSFVNADKNTDFRLAGSQAGAAAYAEFSRQHARNGKR